MSNEKRISLGPTVAQQDRAMARLRSRPKLRRGFSSPGFEQGGESEFDAAVRKLTDAALDVLHHDRTEGSEVDKYERAQLGERFRVILSAYS